MATLLGIDLGSYSVKVARFEVGFRSRHLVSIEEQRLPRVELPALASAVPAAGDDATGTAPGGELPAQSTLSPAPAEDSLLQRQLQALESMVHSRKGATSVVALGAEVTLRLLEMPFADAKKVAQALPFELAGQLMTDLDDQIVDQLLARPVPIRVVGSTALGGEDEPVSLWLAACAPRPLVSERLVALGALGLDPRLCGATALAGAALLAESIRSSGEKATEPALPLPLWVVDLGHRTTHVCAIAAHPGRRGQVLVPFARTIARGGAHLTQALARALSTDFATAEERKHAAALGPEATDQRVATVLREALRPLLRDLRQTLAAYVARYGDPPRCLYLTGGTALLVGLPELLSEELGIETKPLMPPVDASWLRQSQAASGEETGTRSVAFNSAQLVRRWPTGATAVGLALCGVSSTVPQLNFRKGELSYRTDYAFLREKAPYLAGLAAALLGCVALWAWASLKVLEKESDRLRQQLTSESTALFGEARTNGRQVSAELASVLSADKGSALSIPSVSALDLLEDISKAAPKTNTAGPAHLDVTELNIRPKKTELKATAASAQYVDDLAAALGKLACFKSIQKGKVLTVRNIGPDNKPFDVKQFSLEITTTCP